MDLSQSPLRTARGPTGLGGKVAPGRAGRRSWLRRFLGILLLTAAAGGPAMLADPFYSVAATAPPPTITFDPPTGMTVGSTVALLASASPPETVLFRSDTPPVCTVTNSTVTAVTTGTCTITALEDGGKAPDVTQSFQVLAPPTPTITFGQPPNATVGTPVTLSASLSPPGPPVQFRSDTPTVCTTTDHTATTLTPGTCTITALEDDGKAPDVTQSFQVTPVAVGPTPQTITFGQPPNATVGTPVTLSAHASSGLAVLFSSDTPSACTVTDSTVRTMAAGTCTITASQSGSARYAAAPDVTRSFRENSIIAKAAGLPVGLLAAAVAILVAAAAAVTLAARRRLLTPHPPAAPALSVRAVPNTGSARLVSVHTTAEGATRTVRVEPSSGTKTMTIEEARP
jgi:hypothetical protein